MDEIQKLGRNLLRQARTPGAGTRGYASSAGGSARSAIAEPGYAVNDAGRALRFFIPGRDPLYDPTVYSEVNPPPHEYILGGF